MCVFKTSDDEMRKPQESTSPLDLPTSLLCCHSKVKKALFVVWKNLDVCVWRMGMGGGGVKRSELTPPPPVLAHFEWLRPIEKTPKWGGTMSSLCQVSNLHLLCVTDKRICKIPLTFKFRNSWCNLFTLFSSNWGRGVGLRRQISQSTQIKPDTKGRNSCMKSMKPNSGGGLCFHINV